jgi:hypothetical protein
VGGCCPAVVEVDGGATVVVVDGVVVELVVLVVLVVGAVEVVVLVVVVVGTRIVPAGSWGDEPVAGIRTVVDVVTGTPSVPGATGGVTGALGWELPEATASG